MDDLFRGRQPASLLLGIDLFAVSEDIERAGSTHADTSRNVELLLDVVLQAHGLTCDVLSEKAAFDFYGHGSHPVYYSDLQGARRPPEGHANG
jgi:hypothetical protein